MLPVIDLDHITGEDELIPIVKQILFNYDTFLLKNYANIESLQKLWKNLKSSNQSVSNDLKPFDNRDFTGIIPLLDNHMFSVEQYVNDPYLSANPIVPKNINCQRVLNLLWPIGQFFTEISMNCFNNNNNNNIAVSSLDNQDKKLTSKLTHYTRTVSSNDDSLSDEISDNDWITINSSGLLSMFPIATGIKIKPATSSIDDSSWITIDEPDCILVHTGLAIQKLSNGLHTTTPLQINITQSPIHLTTYTSFNDPNVLNDFIKEQISQYPYIGSTFYPRETNKLKLEKHVKYLIKLFDSCEMIVSLHSIQRPSLNAGHKNEISVSGYLLPQLNRMRYRGDRIAVRTFLQMMTLWPHCYELDYSPLDEDDLVVVVPKRNTLISMVNQSRKLLFYKNAMKWLEENNTGGVMFEVPVFQLPKRLRSTNDTTTTTVDIPPQRTLAVPFKKNKHINNNNINSSSSSSSYIHNSSYFKFQEKPFDTQENLLQRIKMKENSALWERDKQDQIYDKFLITKTKQVLNILKNLHVAEPYTVTQLTTMIVDSLYDGNNPIGRKEAETILDKLVEQRSDIKLITTSDGLKVYRWETPL